MGFETITRINKINIPITTEKVFSCLFVIPPSYLPSHSLPQAKKPPLAITDTLSVITEWYFLGFT